MDACRNFRDQWLERALDRAERAALERSDEHLSSCSACAEWLRSRDYQVRAFSNLKRLSVSDALSDGVDRDLTHGPSVVERALRSLPRLEAPAELARIVAEELTEGASASTREPLADPERGSKMVRALDYATVPSVLERLVGEELEEPAQHVAERFVGNLEPKRAPAELEARVARLFRRPVLLRVAGFATAAAAVLVTWIALVPGKNVPDPERRTLRRVHVEDVADVDPVARGFLRALGGDH